MLEDWTSLEDVAVEEVGLAKFVLNCKRDEEREGGVVDWATVAATGEAVAGIGVGGVVFCFVRKFVTLETNRKPRRWKRES